MFATCWRDKKSKCLISNVGTTNLCPTPSIRQRKRKILDANGYYTTERYTREIPRSDAVEKFYRYFPTIDINDRYRQGTLALELYWITDDYWVRIFITLFGVIITNAYFSYRLEYRERNHGSDQGIIPFIHWAGKLVHKLIFNRYRVGNNPIAEAARRRRLERVLH